MGAKIQNAKNSGQEIENTKIQTTKIGNYPASVLNTEVEFENKKGELYVVVLNGEFSSVFFIGAVFDGKSELLQKYKETVRSIRIKS